MVSSAPVAPVGRHWVGDGRPDLVSQAFRWVNQYEIYLFKLEAVFP